ncbi:MAG: Spy/CpxP family protein refolding chaperone [Candidatus Eisenbacteria bacterium]|uniref:Spy/CpxP family protein refolding chaperone n=1 Tax=Eiseniibacteriota bacterium TaxID=2212470 RepID=A0A948RV10_UNCEI|nr:Spy/CpxP family protein refolding chaperone [Candidatus Eisenbacteria bacterium]MBU1948710.1 Spy/CpxP family protein refolding chaperone [Candidatus Eisenbacteria bacterium]MBU2690209.1 Spy/CpxP family protein refolding chaperone [Candidatus Eisenbacteria bacterium]
MSIHWRGTRSWFVLSALLAGLILVLFTNAGWTGPRGHRMQGEGLCESAGRGLMRLESLTDEQRDKIAALKASSEKERIQIQSEIETLKVDLQMLMREDKPNRSRVEDLAQRIAGFRGKLQAGRLMHRLDIREILTPAQREELKKMNQQGRQHRSMRHPGGKKDFGGHRRGWSSPPSFQPQDSGTPESEF